jgi:hypothetical protein
MATQFLDLAGLTHYDGKLKEKVAGSIKIEGLRLRTRPMRLHLAKRMA